MTFPNLFYAWMVGWNEEGKRWRDSLEATGVVSGRGDEGFNQNGGLSSLTILIFLGFFSL